MSNRKKRILISYDNMYIDKVNEIINALQERSDNIIILTQDEQFEYTSVDLIIYISSSSRLIEVDVSYEQGSLKLLVPIDCECDEPSNILSSKFTHCCSYTDTDVRTLNFLRDYILVMINAHDI